MLQYSLATGAGSLAFIDDATSHRQQQNSIKMVQKHICLNYPNAFIQQQSNGPHERTTHTNRFVLKSINYLNTAASTKLQDVAN